MLEIFTSKTTSASNSLTFNPIIGKAEAVRQGITVLLQSAQYKFVGFWDTDLATPLSAIVQFVKHIQSNKGLAAVCG